MTENQPGVTAPLGVTPESDANVDALLARIVGGDVELDEPEGEPEPAEAVTPDAAPTEESEGDEERETEAADPDLDKALNRLRLAGVPTRAIDGLSPEETLDWASRLAARESDVNRAFRERAELEKRLSELEATKPTEPGVPTVALDLEAERAALADQFGDDEAGALIGLAQKIAGARAPEVETLQSRLDASAAIVEELLTERVRGELGARDPRLSDPETYQRVQTRAGMLLKAAEGDSRYANLGFVQRYQKLLEDAALLELGPVPQVDDGDDPIEGTPPRRSGTPTRPSRASQKKPRTEEEILDAKIAAIQKGASAETIRARFGG